MKEPLAQRQLYGVTFDVHLERPDATGAGKILYFAALTADLVVNIGITPEAAIGACTVQET